MIDAIRPRFFCHGKCQGTYESPLKDENGNNTTGKVIDVILDEFAKLHYKTVFGVLDAVNYGVPQFRERFVMIGSRDNEDISCPFPHTSKRTRTLPTAGSLLVIQLVTWKICPVNVLNLVSLA